jgi:hypothetical protein
MKSFVPPAVVLCTALVALGAGAGSVVSAEPQPSPAPIPTPVALPTVPASPKLDPLAQYGLNVLIDLTKQSIAARANSASGVVSYFKHFDMSLQTGPNVYRNVRLHQGTVINPRGATPAAGTRVEVSGVSEPDGTLDAGTITVDQ